MSGERIGCDPVTESDLRRARLLAAAAVALRDLGDVLNPLGQRFADAGHDLFLVGGSVRDAVLGRLGNDLDFTTDARPEAIAAIPVSYTHLTLPTIYSV